MLAPHAQEVLDEHYKRLAREYDDLLYYSPEFVRLLTSRMVEKLDLKPIDILVDLGGGTGMYSVDIHQQVPFEKPSFCVDPYQEMLDQIPYKQHVRPICADALAFSEQDYHYTKVLMKEAVHHVQDRPRLFANIHERLPAGGRFLLVHVPPAVKYPLFEKALERARNWHADPDELEEQLKSTGFEVDRDFVDYTHKMPKEAWFKQVGAQFMTVLTSFSKEEMKKGLAEMEEKFGECDTLEFVDHFDYLTGIKN